MGTGEDTITRYALWLRGAGRSEGTIKLRTGYLYRLASSHGDLRTLGADDLTQWLGNEAWSPHTRRSAHATVAGFYRWATNAGIIAEDPTTTLPAPTVPRGLPRPAPSPAIRRALSGADPRVRLMILLGVYGGLRRAEIAAVHTDDVQDGWLRVTGKGGHVRVIPLRDEITDELRARGRGYVFPSPTGGHLTPAHVGKLIRRELRVATTHQLRHRFGTDAYAASRDLRAVQELLGHANVSTTVLYTQVERERLADVVRSLPTAA